MVDMTKRQILQRMFLRFLMKNTFHKQDFVEIWSLFVSKKSFLDNSENLESIHSFFMEVLEKEYFTVEMKSIPPKYTSIYQAYQIKKLCLPVELRPSYQSIYERTLDLNKALRRNELEIEYLKECFNDFPNLRFQVEHLIQQKRDYQLSLQTKISVLEELINFF